MKSLYALHNNPEQLYNWDRRIELPQYAFEKSWRNDDPKILATVMKDPYWARMYAGVVKKGPWPEGEPIIATSAEESYWYSTLVLQKQRFKLGEPAIAQNTKFALWYINEVLDNQAWPEAEPYIKKDAQAAYYYARNILKRPWPEAEPAIMQSPLYKFLYLDLFGNKNDRT